MRKYIVMKIALAMAITVSITPAQTWTVEQVTYNTVPDMFPVAVSVSSGLMVAYTHQDGDDEVFFADNFTGTWTTSRITDNSRHDVGFDIAARYPEQTAHISIMFEEIPDAEINYCVGNPGSWNIQRVTDDDDSDQWPSLAIDGAGNIHMAFAKAGSSGYEIFYANNSTGSWVAEQVTYNSTRDASPWIALDSDDNPNIVYTGVSNLWFTKKTAGIWTSPEMVAPDVALATYPFLIIDNDDFCHVSYAKKDDTEYEVYYANNVTGTWQDAKVTNNLMEDEVPILFIDPNKKVHIAYLTHEPSDKEIFYANNTAGIWVTSRVTDNSFDDVAEFGRYFTIDQNRIGHIFFINDSDGDDEIYHAYSNSPLFACVEEILPAFTPASISVTPNPFSSITTVSYSVPAAGKVSLKIFDASGSLVRTLVDGTRQQGEYSVTWDGATSEGIQAAPGVYFYQLTVNGQTASVKGILK